MAAAAGVYATPRAQGAVVRDTPTEDHHRTGAQRAVAAVCTVETAGRERAPRAAPGGGPRRAKEEVSGTALRAGGSVEGQIRGPRRRTRAPPLLLTRRH